MANPNQNMQEPLIATDSQNFYQATTSQYVNSNEQMNVQYQLQNQCQVNQQQPYLQQPYPQQQQQFQPNYNQQQQFQPNYNQQYPNYSNNQTQGMTQPYIPVQGNNNIIIPPVIVSTGIPSYAKLMKYPGIFVKQKFELLEALTGCETENKYKIYGANSEGDKKGKSIFKCKEKSGTCARICLSGDCRPFKAKVTHDDGDNDQQCFEYVRDYKCTYLCCNRPYLEVYLTEGQTKREYLGRVYSPWKCCDLALDILDSQGKHIYSINGTCCQLGVLCKMPCDSCQHVFFQILNSQGTVVGKLDKKTAGCIKSAISDTDNFSLVFPQNSKEKERALLMAAIIMLDFRYFEENPNNQNKNH